MKIHPIKSVKRLTSSGHPGGLGVVYVLQGFLLTRQFLQRPSGSSVEIYTNEPGGIIAVPFGYLRFSTISDADIFTS